jgi:YVTN family beta-propeller protein
VKRHFWALSLWILLPMSLAAGTTKIYVLNNAGSSVDVIDAATNTIVQSIYHIWMPHAVTFSADGTRAYITSEIQDAVFVVDTKTAKVIKKVDLHNHIPNVPTLTKDGKQLFICSKPDGPRDATMHFNVGAGSVDIVDTTSLEMIKSLPMKAGMHDCYTTPDGKYVVGGSTAGKNIVLIDVQTEKTVGEIEFDQGVLPIAIEAGPDGETSRLFVELEHLRGFAVVDFATRKVVDTIKLPDQPSGVKLAPPLERRDFAPTHGSAITPDGKTLWITSRGSNAVFLYSLPELKYLGFVPTPRREGEQYRDADGGDPTWLTFTPDGKTAYVTNAAADVVSAIDIKTLKEVARIPVGPQPDNVKAVLVP